jgi:hypothetical protein
MKTMNAEMRPHMASMMKNVKMHRAMFKDEVAALEKEIRADHPDSKQIAAESD